MEVKKCARCGGFFETERDVCNNCTVKDNKDLGKLKNYFSEYGYSINSTKVELSSNIGVTLKNLNRFLSYEEFSGVTLTGNIENIEIENNDKAKVKA